MLDSRVLFHYYATVITPAMATPAVGSGSVHAYAGRNDGKTPYTVTVKDVPLEGNGFWSITVYNQANYLEPNELGRNAFNNITAGKNPDGSITINAGGCEYGRINCIPITPDWNYVARTCRPRPKIVSGEWVFPEMQPTG